jgi:O-antigen/teichoic acid export membrane protein
MLAGGSALGQLVVILASPVLTRLYSKEDMGMLGLYTTFLFVAVIVVSASYELGIVSARSDKDAAYLVALSLCLVPAITALATAVLFLMRELAWLGYGEYPAAAIAIGAASLFLTGLFSVSQYWLIRKEQFGVISKVVPLQQTGRTVGQILLGLVGTGWIGLLLGDLLGRIIGTARVLRASSSTLQHLRPFDRRDLP